MPHDTPSRLDSKKRYLQIALNSTLDEAYKIIVQLPRSDRILIEAGTPLIKRYGEYGIRQVTEWYGAHLRGEVPGLQGRAQVSAGTPFDRFREAVSVLSKLSAISYSAREMQKKAAATASAPFPYVVADLKMMDRGETEVEIAARGGASGAVALGHAPTESLDAFVQKCEELGLDAMIDMMNVEYPLAVIRQLKKIPRVVILHRGVDEERFNKEKQIPLYEIRRIKGNYDILISIAGGDTPRDAQRAIFNDADIVVVWKSFFQSGKDTALLAETFLEEVR